MEGASRAKIQAKRMSRVIGKEVSQGLCSQSRVIADKRTETLTGTGRCISQVRSSQSLSLYCYSEPLMKLRQKLPEKLRLTFS